MYISDEEDLNAIRDIIINKKYFRNRGKDVEGHCSLFEKVFASTIGTNYSLMVNSGTNALLCALKALNLEPGDEVILPSFTFFATAAAVISAGATPIIVNIDSSLMIDPIEVERAVTKNTKAIIAVHMDGHPCDMDALKKLTERYKLFLIEDVAQAIGGSFQGKRLGSIGDFGCFSFNVEKIISCGEGGAITTNRRDYFERSLCIQDACCSFGPTHKDSFSVIEPFIGLSMRVSELSGALMNVQLARLDFILDNLRLRKKMIAELLNAANILIVPTHDDKGDCATSIYLSFKSIEECVLNFKKLSAAKIQAIPISARPAHACWQWMPIMAKNKPSFSYLKSSYLTSIDILMSTLKVNIPFDFTEDQTIEFAQTIIQTLRV